mgnify:CR=1
MMMTPNVNSSALLSAQGHHTIKVWVQPPSLHSTSDLLLPVNHRGVDMFF